MPREHRGRQAEAPEAVAAYSVPIIAATTGPSSPSISRTANSTGQASQMRHASGRGTQFRYREIPASFHHAPVSTARVPGAAFLQFRGFLYSLQAAIWAAAVWRRSAQSRKAAVTFLHPTRRA